MSCSFRIFLIVILLLRSPVNVEARTDVVHLQTLRARRQRIKDVHIVPTCSWFPLNDRLRLAHPYNPDKTPRRTVLIMTARACESLRVHEIIKVGVGSGKFKLGAALLAAT